MLKNRDIYNIAYKLDMIEMSDEKLCCGENEIIEPACETFDENLVSVMNFVDELALFNDLDKLKKFLVAIIYENRGLNHVGREISKENI